MVGGAPELGGRGLAPEVAVILLNGSVLKKSPPPPVPPPAEPEDWRIKKREVAIIHIEICVSVLPKII